MATKEVLSMAESLTKDGEVVVVAWPFLRRTEASKKLYEVRTMTIYDKKTPCMVDYKTQRWDFPWLTVEREAMGGGFFSGSPMRGRLAIK